MRSLENQDEEALGPGVLNVTRKHEVRSFWEQTGVLGPIYRLLAKGLSDDDIAVRLDLAEAKVQGCIAWILHFLELKRRQELVRYASNDSVILLSLERRHEYESQVTEVFWCATSLSQPLVDFGTCSVL